MTFKFGRRTYEIMFYNEWKMFLKHFHSFTIFRFQINRIEKDIVCGKKYCKIMNPSSITRIGLIGFEIIIFSSVNGREVITPNVY